MRDEPRKIVLCLRQQDKADLPTTFASFTLCTTQNTNTEMLRSAYHNRVHVASLTNDLFLGLSLRDAEIPNSFESALVE